MRHVGQGPNSALQAQHDLERWWRTDMARRFSQNFDQSMADHPAYDQHMHRHEGERGNVQAMIPYQKMLRTAPTYSVASDMVTLTEAAAAQFPGQALHVQDLPSPTGFVLLDREIQMLDVRERPVSMRAFTWQMQRVQRVETREEGDGIWLAMYSGLEDVLDHDEHPEPWASDEQKWADAERVFGSGLALLHVHGIMLNFEYELGIVKVLQNHLAFIESLFAIMQQRITIRTPHAVPRQIRRSIERDTGTPPTVQVITLRRANVPRPEEAEEPGFVDWSHRWLVSGHWRRVWNESLHQDRLVWINPYIKGPEDKPLIVKDKVFRLSR